MLDPHRLDRVHVVNVRMKDKSFVVVLSDGSEVDWDLWNRTPQDERWCQDIPYHRR